MANSKAQRAEIVFPPLLNLQEDRPKVASDFRSVEHINAPYINGMLMPLWKDTYKYTNKPVFDYKNNRYEIIDGFLTKNGNNLFAVDNYHFKKEDVTEEYQNYLAFDFSDDGKLAKLEWDTGTNSISLSFNGTTLTESNLFVNGVILTSRVRVIGGTAIGVVVYEVANALYMLYMNTSANRKQKVSVTWCTITPQTSTGSAFVPSTISIKNPSPIINIANPLTNVIGVSLVSNYGEVLYTRKEGYFTFVDNNGSYLYGTGWYAAAGSATETIQNYQFTNFIFKSTFDKYWSEFLVHNRDGVWYYNSNPTTPVPDSDVITFEPKIVPGNMFTYDGISYQTYRATLYNNTYSFVSNVDDLHTHSASITIVTNLGNTLTANYTNNVATITHNFESWANVVESPVSVVITYNGTDYQVDNINRQYTITETLTPTTQTAPYSVAPNVFLDNGNLYAWYTIPEAAHTANSQPITLVQNSLIVESASLASITGSGYTFNAIETHIVNAYTKYGRENSIAIGQNFWDSSLKMASDGIRAPFNIYTTTQTAEVIGANVKYTEYSNSNCSDMLYYAGTAPRNDQLFYHTATANSEDVAWFNPGGFRSKLKGNWNMLYNVDSVGSVSVLGLSYSETDNKMGTLVSPLATISDTEYISASNNFIVYCDSNNKYWKISIEEGTELASVFDNKYIIVNTTSYWNMWDSNKNRKFHYATDYNNRTKFGMNRTEYRATASTYYTYANRRKYATCINASYNYLPRLPITSIIPATLALSHTPTEADISPYIKTYYSAADEAREVQAIDVYFQGLLSSDTSTKYICSVKVFTNGNQIYRDGNIVDTVFAENKSTIFITDIFSKFINGAGNNDFVIENEAKYPLIYNNQNRPMFLYNFTSGVDAEGVKWFFVIQGQYYAVIGEKLYAMIYSNGTISQSDAIVDIRDLYYVGNTPAIAFFVNPYTKQVYSFTGDANLQQIFDASKYNFNLVADNITHWYDESTQSIYIKTQQGLLVFGPQNTYCLEEFTDTNDIEFVDGDIHIIGNENVDSLRYYHDIEKYEDLPIKIETSFWGLGANEITTIDRWNITLYDPEHREQDVELTVRSLTDVSTLAETKKLHINKNDWDKWSHSVLLSYSPKLIKGQAIRLSIITDSAIQKIVPHVMDNSAPTTTKSKFEV